MLEQVNCQKMETIKQNSEEFYCPECVIDILQTIFNRRLIQESELPREWKIGYISSKYKKGVKTVFYGVIITESLRHKFYTFYLHTSDCG